ncbi:MAG: CDP-glycerol glycerophosphotransferase family protein [Methanobrevibacter sp.]|jgi:CDP-glycerol glycerophosphotransferase|nr:CDP-glycerol glycerophosphotransferase family protein [Candidatus Methanoflexus mossambicus]
MLHNDISKEKQYKLTAIVMVYNSEDYLNTLIDSLVNQTLDSLEIILVNDASTDNSLDICKEYEKEYENVKLINKEKNEGLAISGNMGISQAQGEYVTLVDNDDFVPKNGYEKLINKAIETGAEIAIGKPYRLIDDIQIEFPVVHKENIVWNEDRVIDSYLEFPEIFHDPFYWNKIFKKDLILNNEIILPEGKIYADRLFSHKAITLSKKIAIINYPVYEWRIRDEKINPSLSQKNQDINRFNDRMDMLEWDFNFFISKFSEYGKFLIWRALMPIAGIINNLELREVFLKRTKKLFKDINDSLTNTSIYDTDLTVNEKLFTFLILNNYEEKLINLLKSGIIGQSEIIDKNGNSYLNVENYFENPELPIPDEIFKINQIRAQYIKIDSITCSDEFINLNNIQIPNNLNIDNAEIILKAETYFNENLEENTIIFDLINDSQSNENNSFNGKIAIDKLNSFEKYNLFLGFKYSNRYDKIDISKIIYDDDIVSTDNVYFSFDEKNNLYLYRTVPKKEFNFYFNKNELILTINDNNINNNNNINDNSNNTNNNKDSNNGILSKKLKVYAKSNDSEEKVYFQSDKYDLNNIKVFSLDLNLLDLSDEISIYNFYFETENGDISNKKINIDFIDHFEKNVQKILTTNSISNISNISSINSINSINSVKTAKTTKKTKDKYFNLAIDKNSESFDLSLEIRDNPYKLSVVVPVYNAEDYLSILLDSLVNQSLDLVEIILVNDTSTDNSLKICREYERNYENINIINNVKNVGGATSINYGIQAIQGDYLIVIDNDDFVVEDAFEKMYNTAIETGAEIVTGRPNRFKGDVQFELPNIHKEKVVWRENRVINSYLEFPDIFHDPFYWNKIFKRSLVFDNNLRMPEGKIYADRIFSHKAIALSKKIAIIKDLVYLWRIRDERNNPSVSQRNQDISRYNDRMDMLEWDFDFFVSRFPEHGKFLVWRALMPIGGIINDIRLREIFLKRTKKLFKDINHSLNNDNAIYDTDLTVDERLFTFLIMNDFKDELIDLLKSGALRTSDVVYSDGNSYLNVKGYFKNPKLNIPDEIFKINQLNANLINMDSITYSDDFIYFNNIKIPKNLNIDSAEIILKSETYYNEDLEENTIKFDLIQDNNIIDNDIDINNNFNRGGDYFHGKIAIDELRIFEKYNVFLGFKYSNRYDEINVGLNIPEGILVGKNNIKFSFDEKKNLYLYKTIPNHAFNLDIEDNELIVTIDKNIIDNDSIINNDSSIDNVIVDNINNNENNFDMSRKLNIFIKSPDLNEKFYFDNDKYSSNNYKFSFDLNKLNEIISSYSYSNLKFNFYFETSNGDITNQAICEDFLNNFNEIIIDNDGNNSIDDVIDNCNTIDNCNNSLNNKITISLDEGFNLFLDVENKNDLKLLECLPEKQKLLPSIAGDFNFSIDSLNNEYISSKPLISVVVNSYNHEDYVKETIYSILNQTFTDFELIITDDGSTDNTVSVIKGIMEKTKDKRIKLFEFKENKGAPIALNHCINQSCGIYIAHTSSDDVWECDKLEKQLNFMIENPDIKVLFSKVKLIDENSNIMDGFDVRTRNTFNIYNKLFNRHNRSKEEWLNYFFFRGNCLCHPSIFIKREIYEEIGLYDERYANLPDFDMWIRLCFKHNIYILDENLVRFRILSGNKNASALNKNNQYRVQFERKQIYKHFLAIDDGEILVNIFPELKKFKELNKFVELNNFKEIKKEIIPFLIGKLLVGHENQDCKLLGLETLFEIMGNESLINILETEYNFTFGDLIQLTSTYDIFKNNRQNIEINNLRKNHAKLNGNYKKMKINYNNLKNRVNQDKKKNNSLISLNIKKLLAIFNIKQYNTFSYICILFYYNIHFKMARLVITAYRSILKRKWFNNSYYNKIRNKNLSTAENLLDYILYGGFKGKNPNAVFDSDFYLNTYEDVKESGFNPFVHYAIYGRGEKRSQNNSMYESMHSNLNFNENKEELIEDMENIEIIIDYPKLKREYQIILDSKLFDEEYYLENYWDVQIFENTKFEDNEYQYNKYHAEFKNSLIYHYLVYGAKKGYNPSSYFNTKWYLNAYKNASRDAVKNGENPLVNFILYGEKWKRFPKNKVAYYKDFCDANEMDENLVFIESFNSKNYAGNPKYIYEKMLERGLDKKYKFVWSYSGKEKIKGDPILVRRASKDYYEYLAKAKYWINNIVFAPHLKREGNIYLQTWHGTPLKRLGYDIDLEGPEKDAREYNYRDSRGWDYMLSSNKFSSKVFRTAFKYNDKMLETGYPMNDIFFNYNEDMIIKLKQKLAIDLNKKVILYAPTWRDDEAVSSWNHTFNLQLDFEMLKEKLSDTHVLILKHHHLIMESAEIGEEFTDFVVDLSTHDDVQELSLISDICITDYSSVFFDFAHLKRPILFFTPDLEHYKENVRGFYLNMYEDLPGPVIKTNEDLIDGIINIDKVKDKFADNYDKFFNDYCSFCDGNSANDLIDIVFGENQNDLLKLDSSEALNNNEIIFNENNIDNNLNNLIFNEINDNNFINDQFIASNYLESPVSFDCKGCLKIGVFISGELKHLNAVSYLRLVEPLKKLSKNNKFKIFAYDKHIFKKVDINNTFKTKIFDVIIIQREVLNSKQAELMIYKSKKNNIKVIYESDTNFNIIPEDNINYNTIQKKIDGINYLIKNSDLIAVPTKYLAETIKSFNEKTNVQVVKNYLVDLLYPMKKPYAIMKNKNLNEDINDLDNSINDLDNINLNNKENIINIAYYGRLIHDNDVLMIKEAIENIIKKFKKRHNIAVNFTVIGGFKDEHKPTWFKKADTHKWGMTFIPFMEYLRNNSNFDILIAPLEENYFNKSNSELKYIEFSALGIPGIYSDVTPYNTVVKDGLNGLLAKDTKEWEEKLEKLILDENLRIKIVENAQKDIKENYLLKSRVKQWKEILMNIVNN